MDIERGESGVNQTGLGEPLKSQGGFGKLK
jgi:hypothetical protein